MQMGMQADHSAMQPGPGWVGRKAIEGPGVNTLPGALTMPAFFTRWENWCLGGCDMSWQLL